MDDQLCRNDNGNADHLSGTKSDRGYLACPFEDLNDGR